MRKLVISRTFFLVLFLSFSVLLGTIFAIYAPQYFSNSKKSELPTIVQKFPLSEDQGEAYTLQCKFNHGKDVEIPLGESIIIQYFVECDYQNILGEKESIQVVFAARDEKVNKTYMYKSLLYSGKFERGAFDGFENQMKNQIIMATFPSNLDSIERSEIRSFFKEPLLKLFSNEQLQQFAQTGESKFLPEINGKRFLIVINSK